MNTKHICLEIEFTENDFSLISANELPMDEILGFQHGEKISKNYYYLGREKKYFYSIKFKKNTEKFSKVINSDLPVKIISQYFYNQKVICGVIGCRETSDKFTQKVQMEAFDLGKLIASYGFVTLTGGLSGVMEKAAEGARSVYGETLGILPGSNKSDANKFIQNVIPSGLGIARNYLIAQAADILIAVSGGRGTLEEMAYGLDFDKKVLSLDSWVIPEVNEIKSVEDVRPYLIELFKQNFIKNLNLKYT